MKLHIKKLRKHYKWQLEAGHLTSVDIFDHSVNSAWISLNNNGGLLIRKGYSWDGASGPAIDTDNFLRASLVHDALYQLIAANYLPMTLRRQADLELVRIAKEDGMSSFRRALYQARDEEPGV